MRALRMIDYLLGHERLHRLHGHGRTRKSPENGWREEWGRASTRVRRRSHIHAFSSSHTPHFSPNVISNPWSEGNQCLPEIPELPDIDHVVHLSSSRRSMLMATGNFIEYE